MVPTILIVDDDASIREIERRYLEQAGYHVLQASTAQEAMDLVDSGCAVDLLIADLVMPEMGGERMVAHIRPTRPTLKVLYVTGRIDWVNDQSLGTMEASLAKPFTRAQLGNAVSRLLVGEITKPE